MSQISREIITLQVGNYSNHIGAHWFNLHDPQVNTELASEFDPNVLWRDGFNAQRRQVWTPRLLLFDLKGNWSTRFGIAGAGPSIHGSDVQKRKSKARKKTLDEVEKEVLWEGKIRRILQDEDSDSDSDLVVENSEQTTKPCSSSSKGGGSGNNEKSKMAMNETPAGAEPFSNLSIQSKEVGNKKKRKAKDSAWKERQSWGDYTRWRLHSSQDSAFTLSNFTYNSASDVLSNYGQGLHIYSGMEDDIGNGIRRYAENCDYFEGFHVVADQDDGFGGLAAGILQHISDEYEKKSVLCFGVSPPSMGKKPAETGADFRLRIMNTALLWNAFNHHSTVFTSLGLCDDVCKPNPIPINIPLLNYKADSAYESSSILAATLDTLTAPYRRVNPSIYLHELAGLLTAYGHKMTMVGSTFPLFLEYNKTLFDTLSDHGFSSLHSMTPGLPIDVLKSIGNFFVPRGIPKNRLLRKGDGGMEGSRINNVESLLELYSQETCPKSVSVVKSVVTPFKLSHPFPSLFDQTFLETQTKFRPETPSFSPGGDMWQFPAMASAHNSLLIGELLEKMINKAGGGGSRTKQKKFFETSSSTSNSSNIELDDYVECLNDLGTLRDSYKIEGFYQ